MNRRKILVGSTAVIAILLLLWFALRPSRTRQNPTELASTNQTAPSLPSPGQTETLPSSPEATAERRKAVVERIKGLLTTPIAFYGKVIDQHGDAVPDATVSYGALDHFDAPGSQFQGTSDRNGNFSITGIGGAVLRVGVRKEGYYMIDGKSAAAFAYGIGPDPNTKPAPTKENPALFVLQKMGSAAPLIQVSSRTYHIAKNGTPVEVSLATGQVSARGHFRVEAWTEDQSKDAKGHYSWRCRVSVPDGALTERVGQFDFEAPIEGYRAFDDVAMSRTAKNWQPQLEREYFLKLGDGRYARVQFKMVAQGDHFFRLESYLSPAPGNRNLEYDPNKRINK